eukprot:Pgem_evm1s16295
MLTIRWSANNEAGFAGKLFLVNPNENSDIHQIFFDDNIYYHSKPKNIVDVRNVLSGESMPILGSGRPYVFRVEPTYAVLHDDYFINNLNEMLNTEKD